MDQAHVVRLRGIRALDFPEPSRYLEPPRRGGLRCPSLRSTLITLAVFSLLGMMVYNSVGMVPFRLFSEDEPSWKLRPSASSKRLRNLHNTSPRPARPPHDQDVHGTTERPGHDAAAGAGAGAGTGTTGQEQDEGEVGKVTCLNTVQGRDLIADSTGCVCPRDRVDPMGCCHREACAQHQPCRTCRSDMQCCTSYEYCVSCCLAQEGRPDPGPVYSVESFDRCLHTCRTSSRSLKHGNEYRSSLRHCYSEADQHAIDATAFNLSHARVLTGPQGASCSEVCEAIKLDQDGPALPPPLPLPLVCHSGVLGRINSCEHLRAHFPCEAGCETSSGPDQPAYVLPNAPLQLGSAGKCLVSSDQVFDCDGFHAYTARLCLCV